MSRIRIALRMTIALLPMIASAGCLQDEPTPAVAPRHTIPVGDIPGIAEATAKKLVLQMKDIPAIRERDTRAILEVGGIVNKSTMPREWCEIIQNKIISYVVDSPDLRNSWNPILGLDDSAREFIRSQGPADIRDDLLQEHPAGLEMNKYKPEDTFVLIGKMYSADDGHNRLHYIQIIIYNLKTRSYVFMHDYALSQ